MEEEIYIEESNPFKVKLVIIIILVLLSVSFIVFVVLKNRYTLTLDDVKVEVGEKLPEDIEFYVANKVVDDSDYKLYLNNIPVDDNNILDEVGVFEYKVKYKSITKKGKIKVQDTNVPEVEVKDLTVGVGEDYDIADFVASCVDYSKPCNVTYKNEKDENLQKKAGVYDFDIVITDTESNRVTKRVRLIVKKGYSYEETKKKDLNVSYIDHDYGDWNNEMMLTYSKGVHGDELDHDDRYEYLLDLASDDMSQYLPVDYSMYSITEQEIIYVYNKYDYIIGFAIRVKLSNGEYIYLSK